MPYIKAIITALFILILPANILAKERQVVVYTALDQLFSEPILKEFEKRYNIKVRAVYDIEAVKTTGLVNRLIAEKKNPHCDVFWNNEIIRTIILKRKGILCPYISPAARDIPAQYKDPEGYWTGFAARVRVLVVNSDLVQKRDFPTSINDFINAKWQGATAMANPLFGTTATHLAALYTTMGRRNATEFLKKTVKNKIRIVDGNSIVRDMVASGAALWGITDSDDVNIGINNGLPIKAVLPDQDGKGTLLIPNSLSLIAGAPHGAEGRLLMDFILSKEIEGRLCRSASAQIPLRSEIKVTNGHLAKKDIVVMRVDFEKMADIMIEAGAAAQNIFFH